MSIKENIKYVVLTVAAAMAVACNQPKPAYDGAKLWLQHSHTPAGMVVVANCDTSPTLSIAIQELKMLRIANRVTLNIDTTRTDLGNGGYEIKAEGRNITIESNQQSGLLYAVYEIMRLQDINAPKVVSRIEVPAYDYRMLNHWDNADGTVERGYAGHSIWKWDEELSADDIIRYKEYARANATVGINATVLNNVNASPDILTDKYLSRVAQIADIIRPYGLKVFLSVNFSSPIKLKGLPDADPLKPAVAQWWKDKADEIYSKIPDFGGFLVKANSEGLPGPLDYGRSHSDGANMLASALKPHGGIVIWRAFVYSPSDADRAKQAYLEFKPLDGQFADNVVLQIKNGPIDFQPREPFSPLFGALTKTQMGVELQITQEYTGAANHLCYLPTMWAETLDADTYMPERHESTIAQITSYKLPDTPYSTIAGVANIGDNANWTGHPLAQANWYAYGRMAWNPSLTPDSIASEWIRQTFNEIPRHAEVTLKDVLMESREAVVDYMMPLGLHHIFAWGHHYGPEPWCDVPGARADWMPKYYHQAAVDGVGFDRSPSGSNGCAQYNEPLASIYGDVDRCPEELLLWFHHVSWGHMMHNGRTLWDELCHRYDYGLTMTGHFVAAWKRLKPYVDDDVWLDVYKRFLIQRDDARWWHDGCLLYFQTFSGRPIPQQTLYKLEDMQKFHINITNYECAERGYKPVQE